MLGELFLGAVLVLALVLLLLTSLHMDLHATAPPKLLRPQPLLNGRDTPSSSREVNEGTSRSAPTTTPSAGKSFEGHPILTLSDDDFRRSSIDSMMQKYVFGTQDVANCDADFGDCPPL